MVPRGPPRRAAVSVTPMETTAAYGSIAGSVRAMLPLKLDALYEAEVRRHLRQLGHRHDRYKEHSTACPRDG